MNQKKTISINKSIPQALIVGLVLGFITVFIVEHYSKVTYNPDTSKLIKEQERQKLKDEKEYQIALKKQVYGEYLTLEDQTAIAMHNKKENDGFAFTSLNIPHDTTVLTIFLETPFDSKLKINGKGYTVGDVWSSYGDFHDYSNTI